ncbi:MAG TPA: hypothetical protein VKZ95_00875 [Sphingobacteriaceae bacterium]|nr:hypothetical protein [Sphingobacteriaceae bacterium]
MSDKETIVDAFREMIRSYDLMNDPDSPISKEIDMWRSRFLESQGASPTVSRYFFAVPSENLMKTTPEEFIDRLGDK